MVAETFQILSKFPDFLIHLQEIHHRKSKSLYDGLIYLMLCTPCSLLVCAKFLRRMMLSLLRDGIGDFRGFLAHTYIMMSKNDASNA